VVGVGLCLLGGFEVMGRLGEGVMGRRVKRKGWKAGQRMVNEQLKWFCVWAVGFSLVLGACGGAAAEAPLDTGPIPRQTNIGAPIEAASEQPTPVIKTMATTRDGEADACPVSEPVWAKPPEDAAIPDKPAYGHYYVNEDRSMWASAWWAESAEQLRVSKEGVKVGWFRPEGAKLEITGQRLDAKAPPLDAHVPCCYPTRFQATGLIFPTEGCWEVTARAEDSLLSFVVWVEP
jgi:hypothetical protein